MPELKVNAFAKINITLDIIGKRSDGYHELDMIMQTVSLCDHIYLKTGGGELKIRQNLPFLPSDARNLAMSAAILFFDELREDPSGISIELDKSIPVGAGLGGGSSDAAAVLIGLNGVYGQPFSDCELIRMGTKLGADVPYFIMGGTARAGGRGEILTELPELPDCHIVLCKPGFPVSTARMFAGLSCAKIVCRPDTESAVSALFEKDLSKVSRYAYNCFEPIVSENHKEISRIKKALIERGALGASMSGSGPTVFGIFDDIACAKGAHDNLLPLFPDTFLTKPVFLRQNMKNGGSYEYNLSHENRC